MIRPARTFAAVTLALLVTLAGCSDHEHDSDHDHDHDHAAHLDPPHWPSGFPDAITRLLAGQQAAQAALAQPDSANQIHDLLPVQRDLARWLPEIAADSDMPEQPWNQVQAAATQILAIYESALADLEAGRPLSASKIAQAQPALESLKRLNDAADPLWFEKISRAAAAPSLPPINNTVTEAEAGNADRES